MGILYELIFTSGKSYIGVSEAATPARRVWQHRNKSKSGSKLPVHCAWRKYGEPIVIVLKEIDGDALYKAEIETIKSRNTISPNGYNLLDGGQKSPALNKDVALKISISTKKRYENPEQRKAASDRAKLMSDETKKKISQALTGKKISEEAKQKIREFNLGKKHSEETKRKMSESHKGKKRSEESLVNIRIAAKIRFQSPEAKIRLKNASIKGGASMKHRSKQKIVICVENNLEFFGINHALEWLRNNGNERASNSWLSTACKNQLITAYGYHWRYK